MASERPVLRWLPLLIESRFTATIPASDATGAIERAHEVLLSYGQFPLRSRPGVLRFGPGLAQFFLYHPFVLVHRSEINASEVNGGLRLTYRLLHPAALIPAIGGLLAMAPTLGSAGAVVLLVPLLLLASHSAFLFFVHRDLVRRIIQPDDRAARSIEGLKQDRSGTHLSPP